MKKCDYCGKSNDDLALACFECGLEEFKAPPPAKAQAKCSAPPATPKAIEPPTQGNNVSHEKSKLCTTCGVRFPDFLTHCVNDRTPLFECSITLLPEESTFWRRRSVKSYGSIAFWIALICSLIIYSLPTDHLTTHGYFSVEVVTTSVLAVLAGIIYKFEAKIRQRDEDRISALPLVLLLRPFSADGHFPIANPEYSAFNLHNIEEQQIPLASLLAEAFKPEVQLKVIGGDLIGPGVIWTPDEEWRASFHRISEMALGIIVVPFPGREIPWELAALRERKYLEKTLFLLPSIKSLGSYSADFKSFLKDRQAEGFQIPYPTERVQLVALDSEGRFKISIQLDTWYKAVSFNNIRTNLEAFWGPIFSTTSKAKVD